MTDALKILNFFEETGNFFFYFLGNNYLEEWSLLLLLSEFFERCKEF
jgi:hypothetical protein